MRRVRAWLAAVAGCRRQASRTCRDGSTVTPTPAVPHRDRRYFARQYGSELMAEDEKRASRTGWEKLRVVVLSEETVCRVCGEAPSTQVDHIVPRYMGGIDERANLQGLCVPCHEAKSAREQAHEWSSTVSDRDLAARQIWRSACMALERAGQQCQRLTAGECCTQPALYVLPPTTPCISPDRDARRLPVRTAGASHAAPIPRKGLDRTVPRASTTLGPVRVVDRAHHPRRPHKQLAVVGACPRRMGRPTLAPGTRLHPPGGATRHPTTASPRTSLPRRKRAGRRRTQIQARQPASNTEQVAPTSKADPWPSPEPSSSGRVGERRTRHATILSNAAAGSRRIPAPPRRRH